MTNTLGYVSMQHMVIEPIDHNETIIWPKMVVIVLNFNNYRDTEKCLGSILKSNWSNQGLKVILVDNGSIDDSCARLENTFSEVIFIRTHENLGFSGGNNKGIRFALEKLEFDYILLLNNDLFISADYIRTVVAFMEKYSAVGVAGGKIFFADRPNVIWAAGGKINWLRGQFRGYGYNEFDIGGKYCDSKEVDYIPAAAVMIKYQAIVKTCLLPECYFLGGEEADFCVQIRKSGYKVFYISDEGAYSWHKGGYSSAKTLGHSYNRFRNSFLFWERNVPEPTRTVLKLFNCFLWGVIGWVLQIGNKEIMFKRRMFFLAMKDHKKYRKVKKEHWDRALL
jgi:GT2 family glycosyltransferase